MSQTKINLDEILVKIMTGSRFDNFTVLELRSAYISLSKNKELDKTEARRFVYRNILRLEKKGLLKRVHSKKRNRTYYTKSELFIIERFNITKALLEDTSSQNTSEIVPNSDLLQDLMGKLQRYKVEMLTSIGETEEYKELCSEFPELKEQLQESYNLSRDNSSKILGRVKAIESLIAQQQAS